MNVPASMWLHVSSSESSLITPTRYGRGETFDTCSYGRWFTLRRTERLIVLKQESLLKFIPIIPLFTLRYYNLIKY